MLFKSIRTVIADQYWVAREDVGLSSSGCAG